MNAAESSRLTSAVLGAVRADGDEVPVPGRWLEVSVPERESEERGSGEGESVPEGESGSAGDGDVLMRSPRGR
jgi:hypothetical protein